jgi:hypothetical protein
MRALALVVLTACGGGAAPGSALVFAAEPSQVVRTEGGIELAVFELADRAVARGVNTVRVVPSAAVGTLAVTPWMPVMGHGSSVTPTVEAEGGGFVVTELYLAMPGRWELRCDVGERDHATLAFDIQ